MYAIVRTGGKQYRVEEGRAITVERLPAEEGATVELDDVLLIADNGQVTIGTPTIEGARVLAQVEVNGRAKKIIVFKYRAKVRTRKKTGHRQSFTKLSVREILLPGQEPKEAEKPKRRPRKKAAEDAPEAVAPAVEAVEEAPTPKRRTRRAPAGKAEAKATAPKRRTRRAPTGKAEADAPAPKRAPRRRAKTGDAESTSSGEAEKKPAPRRRSPRRKTEETE